MDYLDCRYQIHARTIIGACKEDGRKGVYCDKDSNWECDKCGWCYATEEKRKEQIRKKLTNCS